MLALLVAACTSDPGITGFWDGLDLGVTSDNYSQAEDRFAGFAELALDAPEEDAELALDKLLDRLADEDEVAYYIYAGWMASAFQNYYSPCRSTGLFAHCVERFTSDGILDERELSQMQRLAALDRLNLPDEPCTLPEGVELQGRTLYLVLDLDCRGCREALQALTHTEPDAAHVALCFGWSPLPETAGWTCLKPDGMKDIFLTEAAPFWFVVGADGIVRTGYSVIDEQPDFALPQS